MARFLSSTRRPLLPLLRSPSASRSFLADPRSPSAFDENLLRLLRSEISYLYDYRRPRPPPRQFGSFAIEDRPGEQWIRLRSKHGREDIKVDATMFDGAEPITASSIAAKIEAYERGPRLHISLVVEVSKGDDTDSVLEFICSAWPDALLVQKVFPLRRKGAAIRPYMGRDFKKLENGVQSKLVEYLKEREVGDELAEFLHEYMLNKDKAELFRWMRNVEAYVQK